MAGSSLNHSWPSFSKMWMKRWSFKKASDSKPCVKQRASVCGPGSASSLSPPPITEDVFFSTTEEEGDSCDSDYDDPGMDANSSMDDITGLDSSLRGTEFYRDLAEGQSPHGALRLSAPQLDRSSPVISHRLNPRMEFHHPANSTSCPGSLACQGGPVPSHSCAGAEGQYAGTAGDDNPPASPLAHSSPPSGEDDEDVNSDTDTLPLLVRSMSTSRRHSWDAPLSPFDPGRRFSLDTAAIDSDGDREEMKVPGRTLCSRSDILASEEFRAARLSRVLETSKQAAIEDGEDPDLGNFQSVDGQSRMLMVQKVLRELKQYHGAKRRPECSEAKQPSDNLTWFEFLSKENDEEEDQTEKVEKSRKVKRTLSSLKNRMAGSFKDKGKGREREKGKEREKERAKVQRDSCSGHLLVRGSFSSWATCSLCSKSLQKKQGLQCVNFRKSLRGQWRRRF